MRVIGKRTPLMGIRLHGELPYIEAFFEVHCAAVRYEFACTAVDVLARRLWIAFLHTETALECWPRVVDIMAEELRWAREEKQAETKAAEDFIGTTMGGNKNDSMWQTP